MLSEQDVAKIRKLKDDLDQEEASLKAAIRDTETAKSRIKQVRASIRPAARTRFTTWLTNSDPEENRRYRAAIEEHKDQQLLVRQLKPRIAAKDARITAAVEECLEQSDQNYQRILTQHRIATSDHESCEELRTWSARLRGQVDTALTQTQRLRDTKDAHKEMDLTAAQIAEEANAIRKRLMALAPRMRAYGSFSTKQIQHLRTEPPGRESDLRTRRSELTATRAALDAIHSSLTTASKRIASHRRDLDKKRNAIVQQARAQALGS